MTTLACASALRDDAWRLSDTARWKPCLTVRAQARQLEQLHVQLDAGVVRRPNLSAGLVLLRRDDARPDAGERAAQCAAGDRLAALVAVDRCEMRATTL